MDKKTLQDLFGQKITLTLSPETASVLVHVLGHTIPRDYDEPDLYDIMKTCCFLDVKIHKMTDWCIDNEGCALKENLEKFKTLFGDFIKIDPDINLDDFKLE